MLSIANWQEFCDEVKVVKCAGKRDEGEVRLTWCGRALDRGLELSAIRRHCAIMARWRKCVFLITNLNIIVMWVYSRQTSQRLASPSHT